MRKILNVFLQVFVIALFFSCSASQGDDKEKYEEKKDVPTIALALGAAGLGDQSFHDMQYNGLVKAAEENDIEVVYKVASEDTEEAYDIIFKELIEEEGADLLIAGEGFKMASSVNKAAPKYTNVYFVIMDANGDKRDNIVSTAFAQNEGSFLIGFLAAKMTKSEKLGFIGGVNIPVVKAFMVGFKEGVAYTGKSVDIKSKWVSKLPDFSGFASPKEGYEIAMSMYDEGVDMIYSVAGATGNGIIQAAQEREKFVFGVDSDQDHMAPGFVLTSMMKRLDITVEDLIKRYSEGTLEGGKTYKYDIENGGISLSPMKYTKDKIPEDILKELEKVKEDIANGTIKVSDTI